MYSRPQASSASNSALFNTDAPIQENMRADLRKRQRWLCALYFRVLRGGLRPLLAPLYIRKNFRDASFRAARGALKRCGRRPDFPPHTGSSRSRRWRARGFRHRTELLPRMMTGNAAGINRDRLRPWCRKISDDIGPFAERIVNCGNHVHVVGARICDARHAAHGRTCFRAAAKPAQRPDRCRMSAQGVPCRSWHRFERGDLSQKLNRPEARDHHAAIGCDSARDAETSNSDSHECRKPPPGFAWSIFANNESLSTVSSRPHRSGGSRRLRADRHGADQCCDRLLIALIEQRPDWPRRRDSKGRLDLCVRLSPLQAASERVSASF